MINCQIISAKKSLLYKNLQSVSLPAFKGEMQVLPHHAEAFVILKPGNIIMVKSSGQEEVYHLEQGACYLKNDEMVIIL